MKRFRTLALLALLALLATAPAVAQEIAMRPDRSLEAAARALLSGDAAARASARERLAAEPAAAVSVLTRLVEELGAAGAAGQAGTLVEAPPAPLVAGDGELLQIYDVADILGQSADPDALLERLRGSLSGGVIRLQEARPGVIVVTGVAKAHEALQETLAAMRADLQPMVLVEMRLVEASRMQDLSLDLVGKRPGSIVLDDDVLARVAAWQDAGRAEILTAPSIVTVVGQRANVSVGREISYVADFDVEVCQSPYPGDPAMFDPIIKTVFDGVRIDLTVGRSVEGRFRVELEHNVSDVREPFETLRVDCGGALADPVEVQFLDVYGTRLERGLEIADGGAVLITLPGPPDSVRLMAISVQTVE